MIDGIVAKVALLTRATRKPPIAARDGRLAGSFPDGITTVDGVPVSAKVRVYVRAVGKHYDGYFVKEVQSAIDGSWLVTGLDPSLKYDVVGRKDGFNDVIVAGVQPVESVRLKHSNIELIIGNQVLSEYLFDGGYGSVTIASMTGTMPDGVTIVNGVISSAWTTGAAGIYPIDFVTTDGMETKTHQLSLQVTLIPLKAKSNSERYQIRNGESMAEVELVAIGGENPYTWSALPGDLPDGITLNSATGVLSGVYTGLPDIYIDGKATVTDARGATSDAVLGFASGNIARYWRVNVTAANNHCSISELQLSKTIGSPNLCVGGSPISGGDYNGYPKSNAFDDVLGEPSWAAADNQSGWLGYDFVTPVAITEARICPRTGNSQSPRDFTIQKSDDGIAWTTVATYTNQVSWVNGVYRTFNW